MSHLMAIIVAPTAISTGLRSEIGLPLTTLPEALGGECVCVCVKERNRWRSEWVREDELVGSGGAVMLG